MEDIHSRIAELKRPKTLVRAAHFAAHASTGTEQQSKSRTAAKLVELLETETFLEESRQNGMAGYSYAKHVETLAQIIKEARNLRASSNSLASVKLR